MNVRRLIGGTLLAALAAHAILLTAAPYALQSLAMLTLCGLLPGLLLVDAIVGRCAAPPTVTERIVLSVGMGYAALVTGMLLLSYLPGPLETWQVYVGYDLLLVALLALVWRLAKRGAADDTADDTASDTADDSAQGDDQIEPDFPPRPAAYWLAAGLTAVLIVGGVLRLGNLGYAEFHGDEARAVLRAAAVIQGYEDVLLLHKKGPAEILLPAATFALTGRVTEATARLPFALAGLTALLAVYLLGRRMFGPLAGWAAAMLLAVDGYAVAFSRIVQYQSIVILTAALVALILYRLLRRPAATANYLTLAAILAATGLLAHYEAALALIPAAYLLTVTIRRHPQQRGGLIRAALIAVVVGAGLLAIFYAPFLLHPRFRATYTYLVQRRIGIDGGGNSSGGIPYNNLLDFFTRTTIYNSTYYVVLLIALAATALVMAYRRGLGRLWGSALGALLVAGLALTAWNPSWLSVGGRDLTALFFAAALILAWLLPNMRVAERSLWLWFGVPLLLMVFLTAKPRTHVYVFFMPWALLAGMTLDRTWLAVRKRVSLRTASIGGAAAAAALILLFGLYTYLYFVYTDAEILRTWQKNRPPGYWTAYDTPDNHALFGFPLANGWKAAGRLYAEGEIAGTYATNEFEFWTPAWYTRGEWRCEDRADWFFQISNFQPDPEGYKTAIETYLAKDYEPWGQVTVDGDPRMVIHRRSQQPFTVQTFPLEDYAADFDAAATPDLPLGYPVVEPPISHPLHVNLGDLIWLEGYDLAYDAPLEPGETFILTLYWRAQRPIDESYKVFNQSYYGDGVMVAQQDGYPVCGARGTWLWDPGELIVDKHKITVKPDAPPGLYPLYTGLYIQETLDRLNVLDEAGNPVADQVRLTDLRIGVEE